MSKTILLNLIVMLLEIKRRSSNALYTEGALFINGVINCPYTVEHTDSMLPKGAYQVKLAKDRFRRRVIGIFPLTTVSKQPLMIIEAKYSYRCAKARKAIVVGKKLISGAVYQNQPLFNRLFDRIEKCEERKEEIVLLITEQQMRRSFPIGHWMMNYKPRLL